MGGVDRAAKIEALHDVALGLEAAEDETTAYERAVRAAREILSLEYSVFYAREGDRLVPQTETGEPTLSGADREAYGLDEGVVGETYQHGEVHLVADVRDHPHAIPLDEDVRAGLSIPVGESGVFQAVATEPGEFDETDRYLAELLAAHVSAAIQRLEHARRLREERDRFLTLFEMVPDPMAVTKSGEAMIVEDVNAAFEDVFGYAREVIVGEPLDDFVLPADEGASVYMPDHVEAGEVFEAELRRQTADGPRDFLFRGFFVDGPPAEEAGYGIYTDITERADRQRALERQNERLDEFAAMVSHDLQNPLVVAEGNLRMAKEGCESESAPVEAIERLDAVERSHARMREIIETLLSLARHGTRVTDPEPADLAVLATKTWSTLSPGGASLETPAELVVEGDRERLRSLFENLLGNAFEHGGDGVTVTLEGTPDGFVVRDDGPGLPDDTDLFEPGVSGERGGTGYGLYVVREIAAAHGWSVEATESADGGARFEIRTDGA